MDTNMTITEMHEKFLWPIVRISNVKYESGSGSLIHREEDKKNPGEWLTFVLTNWHVVQPNVDYGEEWDSMMGRKIRKEFKQPLDIEVFSYIEESVVDSSNKFTGDIVTYCQRHDLAIVKLRTPKKFEPLQPFQL